MDTAGYRNQTLPIAESTRPSKPGVIGSSPIGHAVPKRDALHRASFWDFVAAKVDLPAVSAESRRRLCDFGGGA